MNYEREIYRLLLDIQRKLDLLIKGEASMASALDDLKTQVAANTTVIGSASVLLKGLKAALDAAIASGNPAALKALSDQLAADDAALSAAVTANTPAAPPTP